MVESYNKPVWRDLIVIIACSTIVFIVSSYYDVFEAVIEYTRKHENWEIDELITVAIILLFGFIVFSWRRWMELRREVDKRIEAEKEKNATISELKEALAEIKTLSGLLPICSVCKKVRNDKGYWEHVEKYIAMRSSAQFTHTMCPDCHKEYYPELYE